MATGTIDHTEIRAWAESKGGKPAAVARTHKGDDVGIIRLMFPKSPQSEHHNLEEISWDEFFEKFEESKLALLYEEDSLFSKLVGRDSVEHREHGAGGSRNAPGGGAKASGGAAPASASKPAKAGPADDKKDDDLKSREYRDAQGDLHHHTTTYMEQHGGKE